MKQILRGLIRKLILPTLLYVSLVGIVYTAPIIYEWYSAPYTVEDADLLTFKGSIVGNLTVHYNQTIIANITNHADASLTGTVLVEIVNATSDTVLVIQNKAETIPPHSTWIMSPGTWRPQVAGDYKVHIKVTNPEWSD
jgi:hypothetical protein